MKTQVIHLESYDDRHSILDRLNWGQADRIIMIWPLRGTPLDHKLDLKLIHRRCLTPFITPPGVLVYRLFLALRYLRSRLVNLISIGGVMAGVPLTPPSAADRLGIQPATLRATGKTPAKVHAA